MTQAQGRAPGRYFTPAAFPSLLSTSQLSQTHSTIKAEEKRAVAAGVKDAGWQTARCPAERVPSLPRSPAASD